MQICLDGLQIICQGKLEVKIDRQCTVHGIINIRVRFEYLNRILPGIVTFINNFTMKNRTLEEGLKRFQGLNLKIKRLYKSQDLCETFLKGELNQ